MDIDRIERIKQRLNDLHDTHPTFSTLWLSYIDNKLKSLDKSLTDCEAILDNPLDNDPDILHIATAYVFCRVLNENTT